MKFVCSVCGKIDNKYKSRVKTTPYTCHSCLGKKLKGIKKNHYDRSLSFLLEYYRKKFDLPKVQ